MTGPLDEQIAGIALLDDPVRRSLYRYVAGRDEAVSRDEAAEAARTTRENAAFHLDKLVDAGLLEASYRRIGGRTGPGAGRPSKLYRRSARQISVSLPARRYELVAEALAQAIDAPGSGSSLAAAEAAARRAGERVGTSARSRRGAPLRRLTDLLAAEGYEPSQGPRGVLRLRNCPFHDVARRHPEVVCGMNLAFMRGVVEGAGGDGVSAALDPQPGQCCVVLKAGGPRRPAKRAAR